MFSVCLRAYVFEGLCRYKLSGKNDTNVCIHLIFCRMLANDVISIAEHETVFHPTLKGSLTHQKYSSALSVCQTELLEPYRYGTELVPQPI